MAVRAHFRLTADEVRELEAWQFGALVEQINQHQAR